jgi:hypothetical protein
MPVTSNKTSSPITTGSLPIDRWILSDLCNEAFTGKLQSYRRQNTLARALMEYGRLCKTLFVLRYLESESYRRRIQTQLNKGEALHALRRFLFFGGSGKVKRKHLEEQTNQASCLSLVTNAVVTWNTVYMQAVVDELREQGHTIKDEDLKRLSPARSRHINPYGRYIFDVDEGFGRTGLRPLRSP